MIEFGVLNLANMTLMSVLAHQACQVIESFQKYLNYNFALLGMSTMPPHEGNKFRNVREILRKNRFHG